MFLALFYFFYALALISCILCIFSNSNEIRKFALLIFLLSFSGILSHINGGYISFVILILSAGYFSYKIIYGVLIIPKDTEINSQDNRTYFVHILSITLFGSITASLLASTMWQGKVLIYRQVTLANLGELVSGDYFVSFMVIFISAFLLFLKSEQNGVD